MVSDVGVVTHKLQGEWSSGGGKWGKSRGEWGRSRGECGRSGNHNIFKKYKIKNKLHK